MTRVILHIDRLVLKGFREADRQRVVSGVQAQLGRVFGEPETVLRLAAAAGVSQMRLGPWPAATCATRKETLP